MLGWWNNVVFGWIDLKVEDSVTELNDLDNLLIENHRGSILNIVEDREKVESRRK